jgi:anti-anti-sigma factor
VNLVIDIKLRKAGVPNVNMLTLSGEFDLSDQERAQGLLPEILTENCNGVIVDLTGVTYMEEAGIETLIYYLQEFTRIGVYMAAIVKPESGLMNKLKRLGIFDCMGIKVFSSVGEAEAAIEAGRCK